MAIAPSHSALLEAPRSSTLGIPSFGESDIDHIFSWLSHELVQQVINDSLAPQDLGKLVTG
ncbi:hypothetical protein [Sporisorium scitamineum]|uniref:Uncharacterized protein n=1 Tax=Sporisorium scitamineum TaxID=49012 RepID=A0A0F7S9C1_9BASI|nr:hypothetical protein [Sporisorium scitamineum]